MFTKLFSDGSACDTEMLKGPEIWRKKQVAFLLDIQDANSIVE